MDSDSQHNNTNGSVDGAQQKEPDLNQSQSAQPQQQGVSPQTLQQQDQQDQTQQPQAQRQEQSQAQQPQQPQQPQQNTSMQQVVSSPSKYSILSIIGLSVTVLSGILWIVGVFVSIYVIYLAIVTFFIGLVLNIVAIVLSVKNNQKMLFSIIGFSLELVTIVLFLILFIFVVFLRPSDYIDYPLDAQLDDHNIMKNNPRDNSTGSGDGRGTKIKQESTIPKPIQSLTKFD